MEIAALNVKKYFDDFSGLLTETLADNVTERALLSAVDIIKQTQKNGTKIILIGNGGSAAIAEHMAVDLTKNAGLRAITISGIAQITTFANDYGYEKVYSRWIQSCADKEDVLIAISSGGESPNILNAVDAAKEKGCRVITLSGFSRDNPLRKKGEINIHVASSAYGYVEVIHNILLHYINDAIIGKVVYKFR